jgi:hypothetical protein
LIVQIVFGTLIGEDDDFRDFGYVIVDPLKLTLASERRFRCLKSKNFVWSLYDFLILEERDFIIPTSITFWFAKPNLIKS